MRNSWGSGAIVLLACVLPGAVARAEEPPFDPAIDVQLFDYSIGPKQFFTVDSADIAERKQLALDAFVTFMTKPFSVYNTDGAVDPTIMGDPRTQVVKSITAGQLTAAYGVSDKLQIGAMLPLVLSLTGDGLDPATGAHSMTGVSVTGLGDLFVQGKYKLWTSKGGSARFAGTGGFTVPSSFGSDGSQFIGDDLPTLRGGLALTWSKGPLSLGADAGFILRKPRTIYASTIGQQLTFGAAAAIAVTERFNVIGELFGRGGLESKFALDESPMEAVGGFRLIAGRSLAVTVGGGAGLDRAIGAPQARFFFSLGYAPDVRDSDGDGIQNASDKCPLVPEDRDGFEDRDGCPDDDNDGDRRMDGEDKCPDEAEDLDGFDDDDGCPELDNDQDKIEDLVDKCPNDAEDGAQPYPTDGCPANKRDSDGDNIPDNADSCPMEEEDADGFEDGDGCPDADNDADGIPDSADRCPVCPEDKDGFEDDDGCADDDNDKDGVPDALDACPTQAETFNGVKDDDGCPDTGGIELVRLDGDRLVVDKVPTFDAKGLTMAGELIVAQMAGVMRAHDEVTKWLVALAQAKQADAQKLAALVKAQLAKAGLPDVQVLGAAGPPKIGAIVQERAEQGAAPVCPAGREAKQRPELVTPKATMQQRSTSTETPAVAPQPEPAKPASDDEIQIEP
jgi:hypothetical protein